MRASVVGMDVMRALTRECGFFTRAEARAAGYDDRDIARKVRQGEWTRFRRGFYALTAEWTALTPVGQHKVRSRAVLRSLGDSVALSHVSGVICHGIDVWGIPLDRVHVTRLDGGAGRVEGDVVHHEGVVVDDDLLEVDGQLVLRPERCVLEAGSRATNEVALCLLDGGLRIGAFDQDRLEACFSVLQAWPFMRHLWIPVRMADGRSGSIGESRGRWGFKGIGIPCPELQHEVRDADGTLIGISDWWWERFGLLGEFDGRVKYGRLLQPGQDPGDAVFQEKVREDAMREARGARMIRFVWSDYDDPALMRQRFDRLIRRAG
ncbi:type IV toxin-antitoxin system AbiEi family antitoxin domain-containing protein [Nocardioides sp. TF02-7]|uniref:type IV toxin-antitoxin system AbiEi family antitoxin domain-containing protein n=1 Tax=Nocardioides sp. TF02-7 TaxID=2917724 RepID=UPI001F053512|nr:type IV toxin-antitoxin system AbiEi family antitoxin domain-containing protein [Nocardioides sp. TF02-7]UMG91938.1 type IV toxin-antitoxin system AbiEi family antitoxin domain-containing protein [Nocardioides sp. TF02-7]